MRWKIVQFLYFRLKCHPSLLPLSTQLFPSGNLCPHSRRTICPGQWVHHECALSLRDSLLLLSLGYTTGLKAQHEQLRLRVQASGNTQESTDTWQRAIRLADNAMKCGITATAHATAGNYDKADETAKESLNLLKERLVVCRVLRTMG